MVVKRVLGHDNTSSYFISNQAVRCRDIQDVFFDMSLGPRTYTIIGQGMILRIIETKSDDIRIFLEKAAGVSKHKECHHEIENRLSDTCKSSTRVEDILRELGISLEELEGQTGIVQRFQTLQAKGKGKQHLLWLLRKRGTWAGQEHHQRAIKQAQINLEA